MPLNVRRFYTSLLLVLFGILTASNAQTVPPANPATTPSASPSTAQTATIAPQQIRTPTAAEIMRDRISKAKAYIAVRNYSAANYELEGIRRESGDPSVQSVVNVLLMSSYLEQGDYKRAQDFLNQAYNITKTTTPNAAANYFAIASQVISGARSRVERYRALGLNPSDRTLPLEAINDLEKMRETLEIVVTQSKEISKDKTKTSDGLALLDAAATSRSMIARDDYDARKWQNEIADAREDLASSRSVVLSAVNDAPVNAQPANTSPSQTQTAILQAPQQNPVISNTSFKESAPVQNQNKPADSLVKSTVSQQPVKSAPKSDTAPQYVANSQSERNRVVAGQSSSDSSQNTPIQTPNQQANQPVTQSATQQSVQTAAKPASDTPKEIGPLEVGSLLGYATRQTQPVYPLAAKNMRTTGIVKVEVTVDEEGNVAQVESATGPSLLQSAAKDAIKKWRFRPFVRDGQPVKAIGYVSFNFAL